MFRSVFGTLLVLGAMAAAATVELLVNNSRIDWPSGVWNSRRDACAQQGYAWTNRPYKPLSLSFIGSSVWVYLLYANSAGFATLSIDGGPYQQIDMRNPAVNASGCNFYLWESGQLPHGEHTVHIQGGLISPTPNANETNVFVHKLTIFTNEDETLYKPKSRILLISAVCGGIAIAAILLAGFSLYKRKRGEPQLPRTKFDEDDDIPTQQETSLMGHVVSHIIPMDEPFQPPLHYPYQQELTDHQTGQSNTHYPLTNSTSHDSPMYQPFATTTMSPVTLSRQSSMLSHQQLGLIQELTERGYPHQAIADIVGSYVNQTDVISRPSSSASTSASVSRPLPLNPLSPPPGAAPAFNSNPPTYDFKMGRGRT